MASRDLNLNQNVLQKTLAAKQGSLVSLATLNEAKDDNNNPCTSSLSAKKKKMGDIRRSSSETSLTSLAKLPTLAPSSLASSSIWVPSKSQKSSSSNVVQKPASAEEMFDKVVSNTNVIPRFSILSLVFYPTNTEIYISNIILISQF